MIAVLFVVWVATAALLIAAGPWYSGNRWWRIGTLATILGLCLVHQLMFATLAEDAFISFRYAMNLAIGNGPVFNPGERVEGYSNFLWVLLIALPHALFTTDIVLVARILGIACTLGCVALAYLLAIRITGRGAAGVLAATLTAASSSLAAYGPSGLETPLFALLVLATLVALLAGWTFSAGLLVALATMTRPDGVVIAVLLGLWLIIQLLCGRVRWHAPILYVAGALVLAAPWTLWRLDYYGYLMPNALAAKSGVPFDELLDQGWLYLTGFRDAAWALLVLIPLAMLALLLRLGRGPRYARGPVWLVLVLAIGHAAFVTAVGGDWMPAWRLLAPAMPLAAVGLAASCVLVRGQPHRRAQVADRIGPLLAATVSAQLLVASVHNPGMKAHIDAWRSELYQMSSLGAWAHRTLPAGTTIATYANGALSYEAGPTLPTVDLLGLTDEHIARRGKRLSDAPVGHAAHDYQYVVNVRRPDIVFMRGNGFSLVPNCEFMIELKDHYRQVLFRVVDQQRWAPFYIRTERADTLIAALDADPAFDFIPCR